VVSSQRRRKEGKLLVAAARGGNVEEARVSAALGCGFKGGKQVSSVVEGEDHRRITPSSCGGRRQREKVA
jgi:hypothetical protein